MRSEARAARARATAESKGPEPCAAAWHGICRQSWGTALGVVACACVRFADWARGELAVLEACRVEGEQGVEISTTMPSASRRGNEPPLSHHQAQLAGRILKNKFDPARGNSQLSRAEKVKLVDHVNRAFDQKGLGYSKYSLNKLDCWIGNALYRCRCAQQNRRPKSWQPKAVIAANKSTKMAKAAVQEAYSLDPATSPRSALEKDLPRAACNRTVPASPDQTQVRTSPVFDSAPSPGHALGAVPTGKNENNRTPIAKPRAVSKRRQPPHEYSSSVCEPEIEAAWLNLPDPEFETVPQAPQLSPSRSHVSRGLLADHSGSVIIDEPVLHPPSSINESSVWCRGF